MSDSDKQSVGEHELRAAEALSVGWRIFVCKAMSSLGRTVEKTIDEWYTLGRVDGPMADQLQGELEQEIRKTMQRAIACERATGETDDDGDEGIAA